MKLKLRHLLLALALTVGPTASYYVGAASNAIVMAANQGQMPVLIPGGCTQQIQEKLKEEEGSEGMQIHSCMTKETRFKFLADWIVIRHLGIASIGDLFEWFGDASSIPALFMFVVLVFAKILEDDERG